MRAVTLPVDTKLRRPIALAGTALLIIALGVAQTEMAVADQQPPTAAAGPRAKRAPPPRVAPVTIGNLKFVAIPWGKARGLGQNGGYIAAIDRASGKELWTLKVYDAPRNPLREGDVQDVFIKSLAKSASGRELVVTDERGGRYLIDPETRTVLLP